MEEATLGPLRSAIRAGDHGLVVKLLAAGENPSQEVDDSYSRKTPAWMDAFHPTVRLDERMLGILIGAGADMGWRGKGELTTLMSATLSKAGGLRLLIEAGAPLDAQDSAGETALMKACWSGNVKSALELMDAGAALEAKTPKGWTAMMFAAHAGYKETILALMDRAAALDALGGGAKALADLARDGQKELAEAGVGRWREKSECAQMLESFDQQEQLRQQARPVSKSSPAVRM